jgi:hypothetical protein
MLLPLVIIKRWARESEVFSALPDAPVVPDEPDRGRTRTLTARLLARSRSDRRRTRSELANSRGGRYVSRPGTQSVDPADGGSCEGGGESSPPAIPVGIRSMSLSSGSPEATSRSACT